jgi:hypothetical protein
MRIFRKKQRDYSPNQLAVKAMSRLSILQTRTADWLNSRTMKFNRRQQVLFLVIICLLLGGGSLYLICKAIL